MLRRDCPLRYSDQCILPSGIFSSPPLPHVNPLPLQACSDLPAVERNVPRRDCPKGTCEFMTPNEIVQGGTFVAMGPRSDWYIFIYTPIYL